MCISSNFCENLEDSPQNRRSPSVQTCGCIVVLYGRMRCAPDTLSGPHVVALQEGAVHL